MKIMAHRFEPTSCESRRTVKLNDLRMNLYVISNTEPRATEVLFLIRVRTFGRPIWIFFSLFSGCVSLICIYPRSLNNSSFYFLTLTFSLALSHSHTHKDLLAHELTYSYTFAHTCSHAHTHTHTHAHTHAHTFTCSLTHSHTCTHTQTHHNIRSCFFHIWSVMGLNRSQKRCLQRHRMDPRSRDSCSRETLYKSFRCWAAKERKRERKRSHFSCSEMKTLLHVGSFKKIVFMGSTPAENHSNWLKI